MFASYPQMEPNSHWPAGSTESYAAIRDYKLTVQLTTIHSVIEKKLYDLPNMVYNAIFLISFTDTNHSIMLAFLDSCADIYTSSNILQ